MDLELDKNREVKLDKTGDYATVDRYEEFEQSVRILLADVENDVLRASRGDTAKEQIRLAVSRVVRRHELMDGIEYYEIEEDKSGEGTTFEVTIVYNEVDNIETVIDDY